MNSVGIDLDRKRSHVAALDETGAQLLSRRIVNDPQTFLALLEDVGECRIALEATYGWEWLADVLQGAGYELHLAHPVRTKAIASARVKTDAVDARTLAHLLRADLLPEAYIAPRELRDLRDLLRHRVALTRMRTSLKNRVSAILAKNGIAAPYSDMFGVGGTQFLTELELRESPRRRLDSQLALIADFTREIDATSREIDARAKEDPYVPVLCQIRGVGRYIAMLIIAEVGDIGRFATARRLCSWAGLTPTVRSSDGKARLGHISSQGSRALRWALVEAAQHAGTGGGPLRERYERIAKRRGKQIAKVAVALPKTVAFARRCGARSGGLLAHISTTDSVRDLDYLRRLVGDRQLTFYGASAGTFLGQVYANLFARRVRAMVLDGVVDPVAWTAGAEPAIANLRGDTDLVFEQFQSLCQSAGPALCALAGEGPVAARVQKLLERLRRAPLSAPSATPPGVLTYGDALTAITVGVDAPAGWPELAAALEQAASGDGSTLATQARAGLAEFRSADFEATEGIFCADSPARQGPQAWPAVIGRLTAVSRVGGPVYGWSLWAPCASWPARGADRYTGPWAATTQNPILVMGPRFDPSTPFANARRAADRLGNAALLTQAGYGHLTSADPSACVKRATAAYLVDLVTPPPGTVCPSDRLPFDPDFTQPLP